MAAGDWLGIVWCGRRGVRTRGDGALAQEADHGLALEHLGSEHCEM